MSTTDTKLNTKNFESTTDFSPNPAFCQTAGTVSFSFKEQMINDVIPFVERMIEKEKEHLYWLESKDAPKEFIERSKWNLNHLRQRRKGNTMELRI